MFIHKDERGLTLVELLAGLAILGIVTILASTFLLQSIKYNAKAEKNVNLSQEANLFVTALRNQEDHDFKICYKTGELTVDGSSVLDLDERYFETLVIGPPSENENLALTPGPNNCIDIDKGETIEVDLILKAQLKNPKKNEQEPSFRLKTTIDRFDNFLIE